MRKNIKIPFFFIGQAPRPDMMEEIYKTLGSEFCIEEYGALDGLSKDAIAALYPRSEQETLITMLRDGTQVCVREPEVQKLLEGKILQAAAEGAELAAIMCTGEFRIDAPIPVITADDAFHRLQTFPESCGKLGVIVPKPEQRETFASYYEAYGLPVITGSADPYGQDSAIAAEAKRLAEEGADVICLDCMGFSEKQAEMAEKASGREVRIPRTEIIKAIKEAI